MTNMDSEPQQPTESQQVTEKTTPDSKFKSLIEANNVSGILQLLESPEKKNIDNACSVFSALTTAIIKILAKHPHYLNAAEQGCRQIMNSHMATIHSMMSSHSKPKHKKAVLKLLTAIVSLGKTFPRELLNHLTLHPMLVDALASHTKPSDPENVRTCFIHFLLSFIIEGNSSTIKALLDKRGVLSSIFADLIYDSCEIVQLVLKTLKKYILENSSITKTIKIHLFNTSAIESLVNLYNWKGPKNWQGFRKTDKVLEPVDPEEKNMTLNALHELLITLMTSSRYGIVFHDHSLGTDSGRKHNHFINVILQNLERPWEHEKPSELVVEILASCPDLISSQFISMDPYLEPRVSAKWATALQFIGKIIDNLDVEKCLKSCLEKMSPIKFTEALLNLIMPPNVIKSAVVPSLENENTCIHYKTIKLMYTMMKKVESFLKIMENSEVNDDDFKKLKMVTDDHVKNNVPAFDTLANAWMKAFSQNLETDNSEMSESEEDIKNLKIKAFSILAHLNPSGFSASMDIFGMVLTFLLTNIGCVDVSLDSDIRITLNLLINSSGIFDGFDGLDIWIDSISKFENKLEKTELAEWLAKIVKRVCKNTDKYKQLPCIEEDRMDVDDDIVSQENPNDLQNNMLPFISISPLLNAAVQSLQKHSTTSESLYMSHILVHTLHCQVSPNNLILLLKDIDIPALSYIKSWLEGEIPLVIGEPFAKNSVFAIISEILLGTDQPTSVDDSNFGSGNNELSVEFKKKRHTFALTRFEMKYILKLVIFYAVQSMKQLNGQLEKLELIEKTVSAILKMGRALQEDSDGFLRECASSIFKNPVILKFFNGLSKKKTASTSNGTQFFKNICQMFFEMNKQEMIAPLMVPYQNKFVENFKSSISKQRENKLKKGLHYSENIIDILQMNIESAKEFVEDIMSLPCEKFLTEDELNLSVWGIMLPELMNRILKFELTTESLAMQNVTVGKILLCMTELLKFDVELASWISAIRDLFVKCPQQLTTIDENIFMALLTSKKITLIKEIFAIVIFENSVCMDLFMKFVKNNEDFYQQQDVLFYILSKSVEQKWKKKFISKLFNLYKDEIVTYVTTLKTNSECLEMNIGAIGYFIDNCFDPEECKKMCDAILINGEILDHAQEIHIQVLKKLFIKSLPVNPDALKSLVQVLLRITLVVLKKEPKNTSKLNNICQSLIEAITDLKTKNSVSYFEDISKNHSWPLFTRICLKVGLKSTKNAETEKLLVLKALLVTCDLAYEDDCKEVYVKTIFEMTTSHSEFINIMLNNSNLKDDLIELLYILTKKNNTTMAESQVTLYLASYGATLSRSDQLILQILFNFEKNGLDISKYQPYLWGEAAATHYSVKGGAETILFRQTSTSEVFDLLQSDIVSNTIKNFPVHRNSLTEVIEIDSGEKMYDPQFYLPLFQQLLEPHNVVPCHKVIHSGAFALAIAACSSTSSLVRGMALSVISKYYFLVDATSSKEKELWLNFIQLMRNGMIESGVPIEKLRLNGFVSTFLAKASLVMRSPTDKLYKPIQSFLMAKPVLDINTIPEFITLFNSSDIDFKAHRHWILGVVRDGLKTDEDMNIAFRKMVFHTLFMFYNSILCDKMSKVLILQIMRSATKLPKCCLILMKSYCLTSWLLSAGKKLGSTDNEARRCLRDIIKNIRHACSVKKYEPKFSLLTLKDLEKLL
ncbi:uncharacterized protein LOC106655945 [Trichogramma pretiosum]|uniref:uncharacterized protein LOC106655945 n=1 Tax=Trichogramma pretiosum TaxID=7493 RepID=UPI0006C95BB2|nr:uncharacterized protein LOC106655945 [Trichogramma pretiosum]